MIKGLLSLMVLISVGWGSGVEEGSYLSPAAEARRRQILSEESEEGEDQKCWSGFTGALSGESPAPGLNPLPPVSFLAPGGAVSPLTPFPAPFTAYEQTLAARRLAGEGALAALSEAIKGLVLREDAVRLLREKLRRYTEHFPDYQGLFSLFVTPEIKLSLQQMTRLEFLDHPCTDHHLFKPLDHHIDQIRQKQATVENQEMKDILASLVAEYTRFQTDLVAKVQQAQTIQEKQALLDPKACLCGEGIGFYEIEESVALKLCSRDIYGHITKNNDTGNSPVVLEGSVYYKADDGGTRLQPGKERAVYWLHQLFAGQGIVPTRLVSLNPLRLLEQDSDAYRSLRKKAEEQGIELYSQDGAGVRPNTAFIQELLTQDPELERKIESERRKMSVVLQASQQVKGMRLDAFIKAVQRQERSYDELDGESVSWFVLGSFLTHPTDYKADNLMVDEQGRLVGIDNDQAFDEEEIVGGEQGHFITLTNILYSLPLMQKVIPARIKEQIMQHCPLLLVLYWASFLQQSEQHDQDYIRQGILSKNQYTELHLPLAWPTHALIRVCERLQQMQEVLETRGSITLQGVFEALYPVQAAYYRALACQDPDPFAIQRLLYRSKNPAIITSENKLSVQQAFKLYPQTAIGPIQSSPAVPLGSIAESVAALLQQQDLLRYSLKDQARVVEQACRSFPQVKTFHASWRRPHFIHDMLRHQLSPEALGFMLDRFAVSINEQDPYGRTLLHACLDATLKHDTIAHAESGETHQIPCLSLLLKRQAETEIRDQTGITVLELAAENRQWPAFKTLALAGAGSKAYPIKLLQYYHTLDLQDKHHAVFDKLSETNRKFAWRVSVETVFPEARGTGTLVTATLGKRLVREYLLKEIQDDKGGLKRSNTYGRRVNTWVRSTPFSQEEQQQRVLRPGEWGVYLKFYPELPGREEAVGAFTRLLFGYGTPYTTLGVWPQGQRPVLISQAIAGETLYDYLQSHPWGENLDPRSVSEAIIMAMLINPEDGNPTNYMVEAQEPHRLIAIDNDHAFMPAVARELKDGWFKKRPSLQVKTILYCLEAMKEPVHEAVVERFKSLDPMTLLWPWLEKMKKSHQWYQKTFDSAWTLELAQAHDTVIGVPFAPGMIRSLYTKMVRLQKLLNKEVLPTHEEVLFALEPALARRYQDVLHDKTLTPWERFQAVDGRYYKDGLISTATLQDVLRSSAIPDKEALQQALWENRYTPSEALKELDQIHREQTAYETIIADLKKNVALPDLTVEGLQEDFFDAHDFRDLNLSIAQERQLLQLLEGRDLRRLTLRYCQGLTGPWLKKKLLLKHLASLDLPGCSVTEAVLTDLLRQGEALQVLDLSDNPVLCQGVSVVSFFDVPLMSRCLTYLTVKGCQQLQRLWLQTPALRSLDISDCAQLQTLTFEPTAAGELITLKTLRAANTPSLSTIKGGCWEHLQELDGQGCAFLKEGLEIFKSNFTFLHFLITGTEADRQWIRQMITQEPNQTTLDLEDKDLGPAGVQALFLYFSHLTMLKLGLNEVDAGGAQALAESLKMNTTLTSLDLKRNNIDVWDALKVNTTLTTLKLEWDQIGTVGIQALAKALKKNTTLTSLDLKRNRTDPSGSTVLAESLTVNTTLIRLKREWQQIGATVGTTLAEVLEHNTTLTTLNLVWGWIGEANEKKSTLFCTATRR